MAKEYVAIRCFQCKHMFFFVKNRPLIILKNAERLQVWIDEKHDLVEVDSKDIQQGMDLGPCLYCVG